MKIYKIKILFLLFLFGGVSLKSQQSQFIYQSGETLINNNRHKLEIINFGENILFLDINTLFQFSSKGELLNISQIPEVLQNSLIFHYERTTEDEIIATISEGEVKIMKIDGSILNPDYNIAWTGQYEVHNISHFFEGPGLIKNPDGNYLLIDRNYVQIIDGETGTLLEKKTNPLQQPADIIVKGEQYILPASIGTNPFIGVVDGNGNFLWKENYDNIGNFTGIANLDLGFITIGNRDNDGFLLKLDDYGKVSWLEFFPNILIYDVISTNDLGFAIVGTMGNKVHLIKTDSLGKLQWEKSYEEGIGWKLTQTNDEGFAIGARFKDSFSYFLKTDSQGNTSDEIQKAIPNVAILDPNNTRSVFSASGLQFWDDENKFVGDNEGHFEILPESNTSTIFAGGLWLGGKTNGEVRVAAQYYFSDPLASDFKAGLIGDTTDYFNQIWQITIEEVNQFILDFEDGNIDEVIPYNILKYPGKENPFASSYNGLPYTIDRDLAPFIDVNEDGIYNPKDGDYPAIKGDQMLWWAVKDNDQHNYTNGLPLGVEIYYTAYGFNRPENPILHNTIFVEAEVVNKSTNDYEDFYIGQWLDPEIGCSDETLIGSYPDGHFFFAYNRDNFNGGLGCDFFEVNSFEANIPVQTTMLLNQGLASFTYYQRDDLVEINGMGSPYEDKQHYNLLTGKWKDTTPISVGNNGYDFLNNKITNFAFNGNPANPDKWSMCSVDSFPVELRVIGSSGPHFLPAEGQIKFNLAFSIFENIPHPCPNILPIAKDLEVLRCFYNAGNPEDIFKVDLGEDAFINTGNSLVLDAGSNGASYKWSNLESTQQITVTKSGIYRVTVTAENGCKIKDEIFVNSILGNISDEDKSFELTVWPNPSSEIITLFMKAANFSEELDVELINAQGQVVKKEQIKLKKGIDKSHSIAVNKLVPGAYFLHLNRGKQGIIKRKIMVIR